MAKNDLDLELELEGGFCFVRLAHWVKAT